MITSINEYKKYLNSLNEGFFYKTDNHLMNVIQSFKNLVLNLKHSIDDKNKLSFFENNIKTDLITYKDFLIANYNKQNRFDFVEEFDQLILEMDDDLSNAISLTDFYNSVISIFDNSVEKIKLSLSSAFDEYIKSLSESIQHLLNEYKKKKDSNDLYEPLKAGIQTSRYTYKEYDKIKYFLQIELLKLQESIKENKMKVLVTFDGRDAAGKGGTIETITENLDPKYFRVETFGIPKEDERKNWFKKYKKVLPEKGEIVFFDRSWYNRAYIEPVMGYCTDEEYKNFMSEVNDFEKEIVNSGTVLIKIWLSVDKETQHLRFELRKSNPLKYWKYSKNDEKSEKKWDEFTPYINKMLKKCNDVNWTVIDSNDERYAKLSAIRHILKHFDYDQKDHSYINENVTSDSYIFLDIDGVLMPFKNEASVDHTQFENIGAWSAKAVHYINKLVREHNSKVVIISSYRKIKSKDEIQKMFDRVGLEFKIYDLLPDHAIEKRGQEITEYVTNNNITDYIVIDDNRHDFATQPFYHTQWIHVDTSKGFTVTDYTKADSILI